MAMTFKTSAVTIPLYGHGLECDGSIAHEPQVTGTFAADPVTGNDGTVFGVFTITDPSRESVDSVEAANDEEAVVIADGITGFPYPSLWAGTYRINASRLKAEVPSVFASL